MGWSISRLRISYKRRHKSLAVTCALVVAMSVAGYSQAQLYKWVDENGNVQYSDTVPPSVVDRARKELRSDGTVKQETHRAATAEERRLAALKAVEDAKLKAVHDESDRKDKALLSTYTDLADFDRVRDRALALMDAEYKTMAERETLLKRVISAPPGSAPIMAPAPPPPPPSSAPVPVPGKPGTPAAAPAKAAPPKPTVISLLEARGELPRLVEAMTRKRREREDITALYAKERVRLAGLIAANDAVLRAGQKKASEVASPATTVRK